MLNNASIMRQGKKHTTYKKMFHLQIGTARKLLALEITVREPLHANSVANLDW